MKHAGCARWFRAFVALVFLVSTIVPAFMWIDGMKAYAISPEVEKVIGGANKNLSAKFSFDEQGKKWQFNKNGSAALASSMAKQTNGDVGEAQDVLSQLKAQQVGGGGKEDTSLYSVDMPVKSTEGITYYDNVNKLSFKMVPDFGSRDGKLVQDRIVYPFGDGAQVVYTAKTNGLKEDIVLSKYIGDTLRYSYNLQLPQTLEARLLDDGSIGIYSANIALFGNITFSNDEDKSRVMEARKTGTKDNLVFNIPAPFIQDQNGRAGSTKYLLNNDRITVMADGLKDLKYPLTVDPSVTVTTSNDFEAGTGEDATEMSTANQINRAQLTGGTLGNFTTTSSMNTPRALMDGAIYNGYVYAAGSWTDQETAIEYAKIQPDGSLGAWTQQSTGISNRYGWGVAIYNGYIYMTGGMASTPQNTTHYAKLNSDGSLGTVMTASTTFNTGRYFHKTKIYNGYIYVIGGRGEDAGLDVDTYNSTRYAKLKANGDIEAWVSGPTMPTPRIHFGMSIYNNRMYVAGGFYYDNSQPFAAPKAYTNNIISAYINDDGSFGPWTTNVASISGMEGNRAEIYAGYMYIIRSASTSYAPVSLNGQIGAFQTTTPPLDLGSNSSVVIHNGYIYKYGGGNTGNDLATASYAKINPPGTTTAYSSESDTIHTTTLRSSATVAHNGYLYLLGGNSDQAAGTMTNNVYYTQLNSDGSTGAWATTSAFTQFRSGAAAVAYNGYMYIMGGWHNVANTNCSVASSEYCDDVQKAVINSNGTLGAWSNAGSAFTATPRGGMGVAVLDNRMYIFGGGYGSGGATVTGETRVGQIQSDGNVTGWASTNSMVNGMTNFAFAQNGDFVYAVGGRGSSAYRTDVQYARLHNGTATWANTTSLSVGREDVTGAVHNGYLYITGGRTGGASADMLSDTRFARICLTTETVDGCNGTIGTLGTWRTTTSFTTIRSAHMTASYNGYLYVMGGCSNWGLLGTCNNVLNDLQYAKIEHGENGNVQSTWNTTSTSLTTNRSSFGSFAYNGYLYALGGRTTSGAMVTGAETLVYAPISSAGIVGAWSSIANPPSTIQDESWLFNNGYVYKLGGKGNVDTALTTTQYAAVCTGANTTTAFTTNCSASSTPGTFSSWNNGTSMNTGRSEFKVVGHNGYLYAIGGCTSSAPRLDGVCTTSLNSVEVSQINSSTGAPGTWNTLSAGNNFTTPRFKHNAVTYNGYVYVMGGCANIPNLSSTCDADLHDIQLAKLNGSGLASDAGCGTVWCKQNGIINARMDFGAVAYNGYMYITGGHESISNDVQLAPILPSGGLGSWNKMTTNFTTSRRSHQTVSYDGNLYVLGGSNSEGTAFYGDVQFAPLKTTPRISKYSKLLTISPTTEVAGVYYNGLLHGNSSVKYRVAPVDGIFGSFTPAVVGSGSEPTPLCGIGSIYYVQLMVTLNDTEAATFPDSNSGNITDMTTYYRVSATPPPNLRMTGGKWFYEENQRPLDTCKQ